MDQLHRDAFQLLRYSLLHPPEAAHLFFPMFARDEILKLYAIPRETRERIWTHRGDPEYRQFFEELSGQDP